MDFISSNESVSEIEDTQTVKSVISNIYPSVFCVYRENKGKKGGKNPMKSLETPRRGFRVTLLSYSRTIRVHTCTYVYTYGRGIQKMSFYFIPIYGIEFWKMK